MIIRGKMSEVKFYYLLYESSYKQMRFANPKA